MKSQMPISRVTLHEKVAGIVRDKIISGEFEPGQKIPEQALCASLNISRTPLREALKVLATEGILELLPQRGARVPLIGVEESKQIFQVLAALESLAGELTCENVSDAQIDMFKTLHAELERAYSMRDRHEYSRINRAIHASLFNIAGNPILLSIYRNLEYKMRNLRHTARKMPEFWEQSIIDHRILIDALTKRDSSILPVILKTHILNTAQSVEASLTEFYAELDQNSA